jgi:hypothetical protein
MEKIMSAQDLLTDIEVANSGPSLKTVKKWIQQGWITGLISCFLTLLYAVLGASGYEMYGFNILNLLDVFLILIMTYGIYQKSRVASTSMFVYFIVSKIIMFNDYGTGTVGIISLLFGYLYFQAMRGTFIYQRTIKDLRTQALLAKEYTSELVNY